MPAFIRPSLSHSALPTAPSKRNKNESKVQTLFSLRFFPPPQSISLHALFSLEISALHPFSAGRREKAGTQPGRGASPTQGLGLLLTPCRNGVSFLFFPFALVSPPRCPQPGLAKEQGSAQARTHLALDQRNRPPVGRENVLPGLPAAPSGGARAQRAGDPLRPPRGPGGREPRACTMLLAAGMSSGTLTS